MIKNVDFLGEGKYTVRDDSVKEIAAKQKDSGGSPWGFTSEQVRRLERKNFDESVFRQRTGAEVLESKFSTGCTDRALAFIVLARELGVPTRFVETGLKIEGGNAYGHVFVDILAKGN